MPIDASIYAQQQPVKFNSPFDTLASLSKLQEQQSSIAANRALEDERRQALADARRKADADQRFYAVLGNPDITADNVRAQVQKVAPEHLSTFDDSIAKVQKATDDHKLSVSHQQEADAHAAEMKLNADKTRQALISTTIGQMAAHNYEPTAIEVGLKQLEAQFPDFSVTANNLRDLGRQNGPDWLKEHLEGMRTEADRKAAMELRGATADTQVKEQVAAGTVGGLTPPQQGAAADRKVAQTTAAANLAVSQARLGIEQSKAADAAAAKAKGKQLPVGEVGKISDLDKGLDTVRDLRQSLSTADTGGYARVAASVPNALASWVPGASEAKGTQANIVLAQQTVGRIIHGGVMRAGDAAAASKYMPQLDDTPATIKEKLDHVEQLAIQSRAKHLDNLGKAGWDVSNFDTPAVIDRSQTASPGAVGVPTYQDYVNSRKK